jgi:hypothetical protein
VPSAGGCPTPKSGPPLPNPFRGDGAQQSVLLQRPAAGNRVNCPDVHEARPAHPFHRLRRGSHPVRARRPRPGRRRGPARPNRPRHHRGHRRGPCRRRGQWASAPARGGGVGDLGRAHRAHPGAGSRPGGPSFGSRPRAPRGVPALARRGDRPPPRRRRRSRGPGGGRHVRPGPGHRPHPLRPIPGQPRPGRRRARRLQAVSGQGQAGPRPGGVGRPRRGGGLDSRCRRTGRHRPPGPLRLHPQQALPPDRRAQGGGGHGDRGGLRQP